LSRTQRREPVRSRFELSPELLAQICGAAFAGEMLAEQFENTREYECVERYCEDLVARAQRSVEQVGWHVSAILRQLAHDFLVQPDVHRRAVVQIAGIT
jgi:hypothetical protein